MNGYPYYQNPMMQQMQMNNQYRQQYSQQYQQPNVTYSMQQGIPGRIVSNPDEIAVSEVPMDGSTSYFPSADRKVIYAKAWNADGKIETGMYALVQEQKEEKKNDFMTDINERFDRLEKMITSKQPARKKGDADESN